MLGKNTQRNRSVALVVSLLVALSAIVASCGGDGGDAKPTPAGPSPEASPGTPAPTAPKYGGTLHYAASDEFYDLDVHMHQAPTTQPLLNKLYNGLLRTVWDTTFPNPKGPQIVGDLAESWEQPDATTYVFHLHEGVKFQNTPPVSGRECVADDVKSSFERQLNPPAVLRTQLADVASVEAVDKYTVKFTLKQPSAPFLAWVAYPWAMIVPRELVEQDLIKTLAVGTGPFILEDITAGVGATLKRNPDYWKKDADGNQLPYLDAIDWPIIKDSATTLAAFRSGKLDSTGVGQTQFESLRGTNPDMQTFEYQVPYFTEIDLNTRKPPLSDVRVRQAIKFGTDWKEYAVLLGLGQAAQCGPLATLKEWAVPTDELPGQDVVKAKQLLADAGFPNGLKLTARVANFAQGTAMAPIYQSQMKKIGIDLEIEVMEIMAWGVAVYGTKGDYQTSIHYHYGYTDPDGYLYSFFHSNGGENSTGYANPRVDELLDQQRRETDKAKRKEYLLEIQRILIDESPFVWLHTTTLTYCLQPWVRGWMPQPLFAYDPGPAEVMWLDK